MENPLTNFSDHDLLIALHEQMKQVRNDITSIKDGTKGILDDHERRIRSIEDKIQEGKGMKQLISGLWGAVSGGLVLFASHYIK